jgi:hypothetical protein
MIYEVRFVWEVFRFGAIAGSIEETRDVHYGLLGGESLLGDWKPIKFHMRCPERPSSDLFEVHKGGLIGVMPRTLEEHVELKSQMEKDGELLPIHFGDQHAYLFHCLTTLEAIDRKKSKVDGFRQRDVCSRPVFRGSFTTDHWLFKIPNSVVCFATQSFADFYTSNQMTGLELKPQPMSDC